MTLLAAAGCGGLRGQHPAPVSTTFPGAAAPSGAWPYPNGDIANTRDAPDSAISATGKLRWYYQAVPNDFEDHDLQASPISADPVVKRCPPSRRWPLLA